MTGIATILNLVSSLKLFSNLLVSNVLWTKLHKDPWGPVQIPTVAESKQIKRAHSRASWLGVLVYTFSPHATGGRGRPISECEAILVSAAYQGYQHYPESTENKSTKQKGQLLKVPAARPGHLSLNPGTSC